MTTKTISLVLISSALVFVGWGCPLAHEHEKDDKAHGTSTTSSHHYYHRGPSWIWFYHGGYGGGYGRSPSAGPSGTSTGSSSGVSARGGFGGTSGSSGASGIS
jgi:hypothetical protein